MFYWHDECTCGESVTGMYFWQKLLWEMQVCRIDRTILSSYWVNSGPPTSESCRRLNECNPIFKNSTMWCWRYSFYISRCVVSGMKPFWVKNILLRQLKSLFYLLFQSDFFFSKIFQEVWVLIKMKLLIPKKTKILNFTTSYTYFIFGNWKT